MNRLLILSCSSAESTDRKLRKMAEFLGADVTSVEYSKVLAFCAELTSQELLTTGFLFHASTLTKIFDDVDLRAWLNSALSNGSSVFVYGFSEATPMDALETWSAGRLRKMASSAASPTAQLPVDGRRFSKQLAGAEFPRDTRVDRRPDVFYVSRGAAAEGDLTPIITAAGQPSFLRIPVGKGHLFASSVHEIPDPEEHVSSEDSIESFYDSVLPLLIFVKFACGDFSWHGEAPGARLIIDDPLLRRRYGCLDFEKLFASIRKHHYGATVAYIPWNYLRTRRGMVSFFDSIEDRFTICIHGCDHTNNEYGSLDEEILLRKSRVAVDRMARHLSRTGMSCEPIMVFPQGRFSSRSLGALRSAGFVAAVNTSRFPVDDDGHTICLGDLLLPAISGSDGFPVFGRHYPRKAFPFLLDLFLGRPSFIVEHHDFFERGFPVLEALVDQLNTCEPSLSWNSLADTAEHCCWQRSISETQREVRFFTDKFQLTNRSQMRLSYTLWKNDPHSGATGIAWLADNRKPMEHSGGRMQAEIALDPGQTVRVEIQPEPARTTSAASPGGIYAGKVLLRRMLSEFRDEVLTKHPALLAPAKAAVRMLKASSDATPRSGGGTN